MLLYLYASPHWKILFVSLGSHHSRTQRCAEGIRVAFPVNENVVLFSCF